jgi:hypothetical protein
VHTDRLCVLAATTNGVIVKVEGASTRLVVESTSRQMVARFD